MEPVSFNDMLEADGPEIAGESFNTEVQDLNFEPVETSDSSDELARLYQQSDEMTKQIVDTASPLLVGYLISNPPRPAKDASEEVSSKLGEIGYTRDQVLDRFTEEFLINIANLLELGEDGADWMRSFRRELESATGFYNPESSSSQNEEYGSTPRISG